MADVVARTSCIKTYFELGFSNKEILACLLGRHDINLSLRQLKRILASNGLTRRNTTDADVKAVIELEVSGNGCNLGYRAMHQKLAVVYGKRTSTETVRKILKEVDPDGVKRRSQRRLKRREYISEGPNHLWHIDGYDKLKPYGFAIHGCIDGYSRRLLWLEVAASNNDPKIIAHYYLNYVKAIKGTPVRIRADRGTENVNVEAIQKFFRCDHQDKFAGEKSFLYGRSTSNQRIEAWWSKLRQRNSQYWMNLFKDMSDSGEFDSSDEFASECMRFCFADLVQKDLDQTLLLHNAHRIRPYTHQECPSGKPDIMYHLPEAYGSKDCKLPVDEDDIRIAEREASKAVPTNHGCSIEFVELAIEIMKIRKLTEPSEPQEARWLFHQLMSDISNL